MKVEANEIEMWMRAHAGVAPNLIFGCNNWRS